MTDQNHESIKTLISGLNITRYQDLLKTQLDETERQESKRGSVGKSCR
jgi:hypothetical protein